MGGGCCSCVSSKFFKFVVLPLLAFFAYIWFFGIQDGQRFCGFSAHHDKKNPPKFVFQSGEHKNVGGRACIEDIVGYANKVRAGSDNLVGTEDDTLTLQGHTDLFITLLHKEYPGTWEAQSDWHFNHNAAVPGVMKMIYADGNEYILLFGNHLPAGGYSGKYPYICYDFQIQGVQKNFFLGEDGMHIYTPNWETTEGAKGFAMSLPPETQKMYWQEEGGWMIEYGYGNLIPAIYDGAVLPTLAITNDWKSFFTCVGYVTKGIFLNNYKQFFGPKA